MFKELTCIDSLEIWESSSKFCKYEGFALRSLRFIDFTDNQREVRRTDEGVQLDCKRDDSNAEYACEIEFSSLFRHRILRTWSRNVTQSLSDPLDEEKMVVRKLWYPIRLCSHNPWGPLTTVPAWSVKDTPTIQKFLRWLCTKMAYASSARKMQKLENSLIQRFDRCFEVERKRQPRWESIKQKAYTRKLWRRR